MRTIREYATPAAMDQIKALCIECVNVRNELRIVVKAANVAALRAALDAQGYGITMLCRDWNPANVCIRAV